MGSKIYFEPEMGVWQGTQTTNNKFMKKFEYIVKHFDFSENLTTQIEFYLHWEKVIEVFKLITYGYITSISIHQFDSGIPRTNSW